MTTNKSDFPWAQGIFSKCGDDQDREAYQRFFGGDRLSLFMKLPLCWMTVMEAKECLVLAFMRNWGERKGDLKFGGWFYCPPWRVTDKIKGCSRITVWRVLKSLEARGFISIDVRYLKKSKKGGKRTWLYIHFNKIMEAVDQNWMTRCTFGCTPTDEIDWSDTED